MAPPRRPKYTQSEISAQLQQLWIYSSLSPTSTEIELGPIILNIHRSRQQDAYLTALNQFVKEKEQEIEDVCTRNYQVLSPLSASLHSRSCSPRVLQDFVGSVSALLRVRQGTVSLKHRVVELNEEVQKSGGGVADKVSQSLLRRTAFVVLISPRGDRKNNSSKPGESDRTSTKLSIPCKLVSAYSTWPAK